MKVVNLSGRPFVNRRPVYRLAVFSWVLGILLVLVNLWLYADHLRDSSESQGQINAFRRQVAEEQSRLDAYWNDLRSLELGQRNQQASFLNELIHRRTFPWSALFDDLERVLPIDVYLASVKPVVENEDDRRSRLTRSASSRRAITPAEARRRARAERSGGSDGDRTETRTASRRNAPEEDEETFTRDRVALTMQAFSRSDEAMFEWVDRLYADPSFENPNLSRDSEDRNTAGLNFNLRVTYLVPRGGRLPPPGEGELGPDAVQVADSVEGEEIRAGISSVSEGSEPGSTAPSRPSMRERLAAQGRGTAPSATGTGAGEGEVGAIGSEARDSATDRVESARRASRVSVGRRAAQGGRESGEDGGLRPGASERARRLGAAVPGSGRPARPSRDSRPTPSTGRPTTTLQPSGSVPSPGSAGAGSPNIVPGGSGSGTTQPFVPPASGSPQLQQGSLLERLWPEPLLRWLAPADLPELASAEPGREDPGAAGGGPPRRAAG